MVGRMTNAQKARQRAKDIERLYKEDYTTRAKRFYNEENYRRHLGGGSEMRITVPALSKEHLGNAIRHFEKLVTDLKEVKSSTDDTLMALSLMRVICYKCHRELKHDADRGYSHPMRPREDFRGVR